MEACEKKIAVFLPGIGYTHDKPLLYYSEKLLQDKGFKIVKIEYHDLPGKVRGDRQKLMEAGNMAYEQTCEQLKDTDFSLYEDIVFVAKSVGTVIAAKYTSTYVNDAKLVLYTPVEGTFEFKTESGIAFLGNDDPWSDFDTVVKMAREQNVPIHTYDGCNHSLERQGDQLKNIEILKDVMEKTGEFVK